MRYNIVRDSEGANIVVFTEGQMLTADDQHPNFQAIVAAVLADEPVVELFDLERTVVYRFQNLSERVSVANGRVYFDGDEVNSTLTDQIFRFLNEGVEDWRPLVNFWEKLAQNPNEHSRENFYRWLTATGGFTITPEGDVLGYKGLRSDRTSVTAGPAIVDGVPVNGHVPNTEGSVVEMARSKVQHDPRVGCSVGLHVGTWEYANNFGQITVEAVFNPRDVVSVPTDCGDQKLRASRYVPGKQVERPQTTALASWDDGDFDEDDLDEGVCLYCDDTLNDEGWCSTCREYTY